MSTTSITTGIEHVDVLIVGAGISGIGAAYYLQTEQPDKTFAILEARGATGGTWDLFRYPGIRSDSDLHTFGYEFKPWEDDKAIAGADQILDYLRETAAENNIDDKIRLHHKVLSAAWSTDEARWVVETDRPIPASADDELRLALQRRRLLPLRPRLHPRIRGPRALRRPDRPPPALARGPRLQRQARRGDRQRRNRRHLDSGDGRHAAHVTMLQRSPTYVMPLPSEDAIANALRGLLGAKLAYAITRRKNIIQQRAIYRLCQRYPRSAKRVLRYLNARLLPKDYPVDEHFKPAYNPWDQRLCVVPDGDLFKAISAGDASVVTDRIATFTERGILLESGLELEADIIVTATGLNLQAFGGWR